MKRIVMFIASLLALANICKAQQNPYLTPAENPELYSVGDEHAGFFNALSVMTVATGITSDGKVVWNNQFIVTELPVAGQAPRPWIVDMIHRIIYPPNYVLVRAPEPHPLAPLAAPPTWTPQANTDTRDEEIPNPTNPVQPTDSFPFPLPYPEPEDRPGPSGPGFAETPCLGAAELQSNGRYVFDNGWQSLPNGDLLSPLGQTVRLYLTEEPDDIGGTID
jgi:hypothetical protein